ncbi:uncharacterized protein LOC127796863 [Diospyros lotus]|uniref:uncharacterized protein LOC127796863 n=1 Tax=Diospyros lotus TaxID=55363 RepID=UPI00225102A7|nr:uncharacterized protein LOC127796863 [Diospyros lotus]
MEAHKERALLRCFKQSNQLVQNSFDSITEVVRELKNSYDSLLWQDDIKRFVKLMMLDGCFMLELLRVAYQPKNYYSDDDHVFSRYGDLYVVPFIRVDMLLLENQLPMLLLLKLKYIFKNDEPDVEELNKDIFRLFDHDSNNLCYTETKMGNVSDKKRKRGNGRNNYSKMDKCLHVLDLHRKGLLHTHNQHGNAAPQSLDQGEGKNKRSGHNVVRPATELHEAGIHFMKSESKSLRDITFSNGILKLPNFMVTDDTELMFLNLIAFERCHIPAGNDITSFVAFMDRIIDGKQDIKILSSKGIIDNFIGSDEEAADLFNTISKDLIMEMTGNLDQVYTNLIVYCNKPWNKWRANLTQTYFRSPWAIISVIAAILLFSLATVQTIFTILN